MKDLDFDELDRAVSSLMSDVDTSAAGASPQSPLSSIPATPAEPEEAASVSTPRVEEEPSPTTSPVDSASLATRRSGRFMDVVHPSSDMRTTSMATPSRQGLTIAPRTTTPSVESMPQQLLTSSTPPVQPSPPPVTNTWSDPIEAPEESSSEPSIPEATQPDAQSGLTSPFLPDTKVEKRPLGGQNLDAAIAAELSRESPESDESEVTSDDSAPVSVEDVPTPSAVDTQSPTDESTEIKPILPAELDSDLVAIEAGESTVEKNRPAEVAVPVQPAAPTPSLVAGSIPQQYAEQPSTGDASHAPIYDSEEVHQPLAHPAKKKSGWLWVVWILVILALGAGAGAAVFFFHLI